MLDVTASDASAFFVSWQAARLARTDLKPMGVAGLTQASLVWRHWLAFCTVHSVAWLAVRPVGLPALHPGSRLGAHLVQPCLPAAWRCGKKAGTCSSASRTCKAIPET